MLRAILNKSWRQHPTRHQLYSHLPPITKTIQVRRTRHAGHYWRRKNELISDVLLWTPAYGQAKAGRPARTYIQLCEDIGCSPEDQPEAMNDREKWRERVRDIRASGTTWWWWWRFVCLACVSQILTVNHNSFFTKKHLFVRFCILLSDKYIVTITLLHICTYIALYILLIITLNYYLSCGLNSITTVL